MRVGTCVQQCLRGGPYGTEPRWRGAWSAAAFRNTTQVHFRWAVEGILHGAEEERDHREGADTAFWTEGNPYSPMLFSGRRQKKVDGIKMLLVFISHCSSMLLIVHKLY